MFIEILKKVDKDFNDEHFLKKTSPMLLPNPHKIRGIYFKLPLK